MLFVVLQSVAGVVIAMLLCSPDGRRTRERGDCLEHHRDCRGAGEPGRILDSRTMAAVHAAIHDSVNAVDRRYRPYLRDDHAPGASLDAAVAAAAHDVLQRCRRHRTWSPHTLPRWPRFRMARRRLRESPSGSAVRRPCWIASQPMASLRRQSRSMSPPASRATTTRRPSTHRPAWGRRSVSGWGRVEPWAIDVENHQVRGPDPLDSIQHALDFQHLKAIGSVNSALRTPEQTEIAKFWAEGAPAGWNRIANTVIQQMDSTRGTLRGFSPSSTSRWPTASSPALMPLTTSGSGGHPRRSRGQTKTGIR